MHLAYESAISAISEARGHLAQKRIMDRSQAVTKAQLILIELQKSLDLKKGGDLAAQLNRLYDYIQRLLIDGNFRQVEAPFVEAQSLLETLDEGWKAISQTERPVVATAFSGSWMTGDHTPETRTSLHL